MARRTLSFAGGYKPYIEKLWIEARLTSGGNSLEIGKDPPACRQTILLPNSTTLTATGQQIEAERRARFLDRTLAEASSRVPYSLNFTKSMRPIQNEIDWIW